MNKAQFLRTLGERLRGLPEIDIARSLDYWEEMIDDRTEDGMSEEEAVAAMGDPEAVAREILQGAGLSQAPASPAAEKRSGGFGRGLLIALASPFILVFWVLMLAAAIVLWCVPVTFWAVFAGIAATAVGCIPAAVFSFASGGAARGLLFAGGALFSAGLAVYLWYFALLITKGIAWLTVILFRACAAPFRKGN